MASHPNDRGKINPRIQCAVCHKWMRLHRAPGKEPADMPWNTQRFYGGCGYTGNDHYPVKGDYDVCDDCCHTHCKPKAIAEGLWAEPTKENL